MLVLVFGFPIGGKMINEDSISSGPFYILYILLPSAAKSRAYISL